MRTDAGLVRVVACWTWVLGASCSTGSLSERGDAGRDGESRADAHTSRGWDGFDGGAAVDGASVDGASVDGASVNGAAVDGANSDGHLRDALVDTGQPDTAVVDAAIDARDAPRVDAGLPCTLTPSGPVTVTSDGEIVENLRIESAGEPGIGVEGYRGVIIRNVEILHEEDRGIFFSNADDLTIENVSIEHTGAPVTGPNPSSDRNNIECLGSARAHIRNVRLSRGSSGIYLVSCPDSRLTGIEGYDFRGPFPRGQLVQWNRSDRGTLEDFSVISPETSWPEDNVNVYRSVDATIRRGHIDGNNSPSGIGVIFDGDTSVGLVEDVDAIRMGNGCFSAYAGAEGSIFRRTRCRENICTDQGRGLPTSNALMWAGNSDLSMLRIEASSYWASCNGNLVWPRQSFEVVELEERDFTMRAPVTNRFCWE